MTPEHFIEKWKASELNEKAAAQSHFNDLCALLDEPTPTDADPKGEWYCFERGAVKTTGAKGWADVWKRHYFGWEYKGPGKDLDKAFAQLQQYAVALENPPLLVVCDTEIFRIHTNWTNTVSDVHEITLDDLMDSEKRAVLKAVFSNPERLKPTLTRDALTQDMASKFAGLAQELRDAGHDPQKVAHFLNRLVFCMFAEDVNLLPNNLFTELLNATIHHSEQFEDNARQLFTGMKVGGVVAFKQVEWFNGALFDDDETLPLTRGQIKLVLEAARMDWSAIDPSILGTLFERGLDPDKRSQLGAHYTDREKVMMIVEPVIKRPLENEWGEVRSSIQKDADKAMKAKGGARTRAFNTAEKKRQKFMDRLRNFRVLDPACGSGNFLYLALMVLKDLEHRINLDCEALGLHREFPSIGPEVVKGIEINPYAAELARVSIWIGEIQWMKRNGFEVGKNPILKPLGSIECRDALLDDDGKEAIWPAADVVVGNPPFLGGVKFRRYLGDGLTDQLRTVFSGRLPGTSDLVTYWFEKARELVSQGDLRWAGLVATNSIRGQGSRAVLDKIRNDLQIFCAWSDEPWVVYGAAVRVSLVCFCKAENNDELAAQLDGHEVEEIFSDLTGTTDIDLTKAAQLPENTGITFQGSKKVGAFEVSGEQAREWLALPVNPNGRSNSDVLKPSWVAMDVVRIPRDKWIVDFGLEMLETNAALFEAPFLNIETVVKPKRTKNRRQSRREFWWRHGDPQPRMRSAIKNLDRYIVTPEVSKHRIFRWAPGCVLPDCKLMVIARDDDVSFGILQSRFHIIWSLRKGMTLEDRPTYTASSTFETFPFPDGLTPDIPASDYASDPRAQKVADAAKRLDELRENWLNPANLIKRVPEDVSGYPDRILPVNEDAAEKLKKRTLTKLYNERPAWLDNAHQELDEAVAAAYGWPADLSDDEVLEKLFALNLARGSASKKD